jgi:ACS family glucarate transporter-like MFS transporter
MSSVQKDQIDVAEMDVGEGAAKPTRFRWVVLILIVAVYTVVTADRANIGIALPFIRQDFPITNTEAGAMISLFFVFYALAQIPAGLILSRFGVRNVIPAALTLTSVVAALMGTASTAFLFKIYRALLGITEAPMPLGMPTTINNWFPTREKATAAAVFLSASKLGPVIVPTLGAVLIAAFGWRSIFYVCAIPGVFLAIAWYYLVPDGPERSTRVNAHETSLIRNTQKDTQSDTRPQARPVVTRRFEKLDFIIRTRDLPPLETRKSVFGSVDIWGIALCNLLMVGLMNVILAWLPTYLITVKNFSLLSTGMVSAVPFVGGIVGNLIGGTVSDRVLGQRRKPAMMIAAASSAAMLLLLINAPNDVIGISVLLFLTGVCLNFGYWGFSVYPMGLTTKSTYPVAASVVNTCGQAGGAMAPFVTGVLLDSHGWGSVFTFLAICSLSTFVILLIMREPRPAA